MTSRAIVTTAGLYLLVLISTGNCCFFCKLIASIWCRLIISGTFNPTSIPGWHPQCRIAAKVKEAIILPPPKLKGCFKDEVLNRDFTDYGGIRLNGMNARECQKMCKSMVTAYMGLQGDECWCGNAYGKHGQGKDSDCSQVCSGNMAEFCGGESFNTVYEVNPND